MMKINQNIILKSLALLLCFYIAILPIFQYKTVKASTFDKVKAFTYATVEILMGLKAVGFISDTTLTPENLENIYNKADAYLHENFGTELEYAEALRQVDQLGLDIASGQIFIPGNYSGKLWYSFLNAVVDVVWPHEGNSTSPVLGLVYMGTAFGYDVFAEASEEFLPPAKAFYNTSSPREDAGNYTFKLDMPAPASKKLMFRTFRCDREYGGNYLDYNITTTARSFTLWARANRNYNDPKNYVFYNNDAVTSAYIAVLSPRTRVICKDDSSSAQNVPSVKKKTANKVKLPTRLPQTVINNINNYVDGSTENLIVNPSADELPQLPEGYNPVTDDPPDLPGYEDVTPDQPGTTDPEPTPTPPDPTPTPPEYDGSSWIKPIGDFFAGLLSFLKDALIPTQTVDFSPLQNMGADVSSKFPFSLPGDIGKLFGVLNAEPIRPHFEMDFDLSKVGIPGEPIHWDLNVEQWDNGAAVVKTALYIAFLIGLVFITKQFMQN